jgi:LacI family transcriptional regulator
VVELREVGRAPVMADVARVAGVSQKTVSRVVNSAPNVRAEVRERVHAAIAELGYRPNAAARALVTHRTGVIGILTPDSLLYGPTAQLFGLERAAHEAGYAVVIVSVPDGSRTGVLGALTRLRGLGVDGIALGAPLLGEALPVDLFRGVPFVVVGDQLPETGGSPTIICDQYSGARQATEHLLGLGHETVWHVAGPTTWYSSRARETGWARALDAAGVRRPDPVVGDWTARSGYAAGLVLAERPDVTAVFAANDQMAWGLMRAMAERGRRVPEDVSVVGFDDVPESEFQLVPLTTVRQDFTTMAHLAVTELVKAMTGKESATGTICIPVQLLVRSSTGRAP